MDELESKLSAIMNDPEAMGKIMALAQNLGGSDPPPKPEPHPSMPDIDFSMLQKLGSLSGQGSIDKNQKNLLQALGPYLSKQRLSRLERAMRAAKMAGIATAIFPNLKGGR